MEIEIADTFFKRLIGLMWRKEVNKPLLIAPCKAIHMLFMKVEIDAVFIDSEYRIKKISNYLKPWKGVAVCAEAWGVIEMKAGEANRLKLKIGEKLKVEWQ